MASRPLMIGALIALVVLGLAAVAATGGFSPSSEQVQSQPHTRQPTNNAR
jgi:hypothetical protein